MAPGLVWPGGPGFLAETLARLSRGESEALFVSLHDHAGHYLASFEFPGSPRRIDLRLRAIVEAALANRASGLLLAHNHPSGDPSPSQADIEGTRGLAALCRPLDLELHDHLIIASGTVRSMRAAGLLDIQRKAA